MKNKIEGMAEEFLEILKKENKKLKKKNDVLKKEIKKLEKIKRELEERRVLH